MTQKERYERFRSDVCSVKAELLEANSTEFVDAAITRLATLMESSVNDAQLKDIYNWTADVNGTIHVVRMHDYTRNELASLLDSMLDSVNSLITAEKAKENANKLRAFFQNCAEHADEIAQIVDINKIFG